MMILKMRSVRYMKFCPYPDIKICPFVFIDYHYRKNISRKFVKNRIRSILNKRIIFAFMCGKEIYNEYLIL